MPSIEESKQQVRARLDRPNNDIDHDAILVSLQHEIDKHNEIKSDLEHSLRRNRKKRDVEESRSQQVPSMRFRFKKRVLKPTKRKHRSTNDGNGFKDKSQRPHVAQGPVLEDFESAHPFPREPTEQTNSNVDAQAAFRESLFDALADDEGALYWEGVYSQPVHIYVRPSVKNEKGELEQMDDDEYAAYVQTRMWERKHPEVVQERKNRERAQRSQQEERDRRKAEFVRKRQRAAWERAQGWSADSDDEGDTKSGKRRSDRFGFAGNINNVPEGGEKAALYEVAWSTYLGAWEKLKQDVLVQRDGRSVKSHRAASDGLPWPVAIGKPVNKVNIGDFMRHAPHDHAHTLASILKRERVRWHPDKMQQFFAGDIDDDTMKKVTSVFQVIDELYERILKGDHV